MCDSCPTEQNADGWGGAWRRKVGGQSDGSEQAGAQSVDDRRRADLVGKTTKRGAVPAVVRVTHDQHVVVGRRRVFISNNINTITIKFNIISKLVNALYKSTTYLLTYISVSTSG